MRHKMSEEICNELNLEEKTCKNCFYFRRHYAKYRLRFFACDTGLCKGYRTPKVLKFPFSDTCSRWKKQEDDDKWRRELAPQAILAVCERLEELAALLREE